MRAAPSPSPHALLHTPIDWRAKARHLATTWAFCGVIALLQVAFVPERSILPPLVFSFLIGTTSWAIVDFGRHFFPSARDNGWPALLPSLVLVTTSILAGFYFGTRAGDAICRALGWYGPQAPDGLDARSAILITTLAGVVGTYYFWSMNRSRWLQQRMGEAQRHAAEARLKLLETQLEPHMLFNTLANLRALIGVDPQRAQAMLDHLIDYLRATLDGSRRTTHPLQAEFDRLRDYLALMAIRMGPRLQVSLQLPPALAAQPVPTLLLQPLVENAIQHGLEPQVAGGPLEVAARQDGRALVLEVTDGGVGPGAAPAGGGPGNGTGSGFGLAQVRERLATLYGPEATLAIGPAPGRGTRVEIRLPIAP